MNERSKLLLREIADSVAAGEENLRAWTGLATGGGAPARHPRPRRLVLAVAAVAAVLMLAGFGYGIASRYFDKIFQPNLEQELELVAEDDLRALRRQPPGSLLCKTYETEYGLLRVRAMRGETMDSAFYDLAGRDTSWEMIQPHKLTHNRDSHYTPAEPLEYYIRAGMVVPGLDEELYELTELWEEDGHIYELRYRAKSGEDVYIRGIISARISDIMREDMTARDIAVGDRAFTYVTHPERGNRLYLYLGENKLNVVLDIYGEKDVTKKQLLKAAENLTLYNEEANELRYSMPGYYEGDFFAGLPDPVLRGKAAEIAAALASGQETGWDGEGRRVSLSDRNLLNIIYDGSARGELAALTPFTEATPFDGEAWFPADGCKEMAVRYFRERPTAVCLSSEGFSWTLEIVAPDDRAPAYESPLDILAINANHCGETLARLLYGQNGQPYLVGFSEMPGAQRDIYIGGALESDGEFYRYTLRLAEEHLSPETVEALLGTE